MSNRLSGFVWVVFGLALACLMAGAVQAQEGGVLQGRVVNGTADGTGIGAGVPVTLRAFRGSEEVGFWETTTDADGRFRFEGLDTDATLEYWPEVLYLDVLYSIDAALRFDDEPATLDAPIGVYETTDDDGDIRLDSVHIIAESFGQVLRISEIHLFGNGGDRTYVGRDGQTLFIPLPEEAVGVAFQEGTAADRYVEVSGGFVDSEPLPPGPEASMAFFSYHLMVTGSKVPLERRFAYPVGDLSILVAQPGLTMQSDQVLSQGTELFQGQQYELFASSNLAPDEPLTLEFQLVEGESSAQGMPEASTSGKQEATPASSRGNQSLLRVLGFILALMAVVGAVVYALGARHPAGASASAPDLAANPKARRLLAELAGLEDAWEAGQIDEATYERQRAEKYEALKSL